MPSFVTRVELPGEGADYEALHAAMGKQGFARFIPHSSGRMFMLPSGTYFSSHSIESVNSQAVSLEAQKIADAIRPGCWVLVTVAEGWTGVLVEAKSLAEGAAA